MAALTPAVALQADRITQDHAGTIAITTWPDRVENIVSTVTAGIRTTLSPWPLVRRYRPRWRLEDGDTKREQDTPTPIHVLGASRWDDRRDTRPPGPRRNNPRPCAWTC